MDNLVSNFPLHLESTIPIPDFEGDPTDSVLNSLCSYLMEYKDEEDVLSKIKNEVHKLLPPM